MSRSEDTVACFGDSEITVGLTFWKSHFPGAGIMTRLGFVTVITFVSGWLADSVCQLPTISEPPE